MLEAITTTTTERRHPGVSTSSEVNFCNAEDTNGRVCMQIQMSACKVVTLGAWVYLLALQFHCVQLFSVLSNQETDQQATIQKSRFATAGLLLF